jgi:FkbM family methyltransferase
MARAFRNGRRTHGHFLRRWAERWSRGVVFSRTLRTPAGPRKLWVTPEASLHYWLPHSLRCDRPLERFLRDHIEAGSRVWDIGANVGVATFFAAAVATRSGSVLAVEADPAMASLLWRSTEELGPNDAKPIILTAAVADGVGLEEFVVPVRSRAANYVLGTGGSTQAGGVRYTQKSVGLTLDWLLERTFSPSVVKMDIEGMEARALRASPKLLTEARPIFHLEVWEEAADEITSLLRNCGYVLRDGQGEGYPEVARATWCTVATPSGPVRRA